MLLAEVTEEAVGVAVTEGEVEGIKLAVPVPLPVGVGVGVGVELGVGSGVSLLDRKVLPMLLAEAPRLREAVGEADRVELEDCVVVVGVRLTVPAAAVF